MDDVTLISVVVVIENQHQERIWSSSHWLHVGAV